MKRWAFDHEDVKYLNLLASYFNGLGGPLFKIREVTGDAYQISCAQVSRRMTGHFVFNFVLAAHSKKDAVWVKKRVFKNIKKVQGEKLRSLDISRALNSLKGAKAISQQSLSDQSLQLLQYELLGKGFRGYFQECLFPSEAISFLSERLREMADRYFKPGNFILLSVGAKR